MTPCVRYKVVGMANMAGNSRVSLWQIPLQIEEEQRVRLWRILPAEERERAIRFRFDQDRDRFIACRGRLRRLLGRCLGQSPEEVGFRIGPYGKPQIAGPECGLRFNLSHSSDRALVAITSGHEVGVDLERLRHDFDPILLAEGRFAPHEIAALRAAPERRRHARFLQLWTAKEACLKATGQGLMGNLARFPIPLCGKAVFPLGSEESASSPVPMGRLSLAPLQLGGGYLAALALQGPMLPIDLQHWTCDE